MAKRIGIFSGVFDPVHKGHIGLTLAAIRAAQLDAVYFLVEAKPRHKKEVTHVSHRLAMVKLAIKPYPRLAVLDLPDKQFSVAKTLPRLKRQFPHDELLLVCGSDMLSSMPDWDLVYSLLDEMGLVIGLRTTIQLHDAEILVDKLPAKPKEVIIVSSPKPYISSKQIRAQLIKGKASSDLLPSLKSYVKKHWLYAAPSSSNSSS